MPAKPKQHRFRVQDEVRIIQDLSGKEPQMVGRLGQIKELLPVSGRYPQYKVLIFGGEGIIGGIFEVDERELGLTQLGG